MSAKYFKPNRRQFLKSSSLAAFGVAASGLLPRQVFAAEGDSDHTLVYIFLRGGMDALSILPPLAPQVLPKYLASRPKISFDASVLKSPTGGDYAFGINSELSALKQLWDSGDISFIHGMGSLTNTTSHFDQMNYIEGGSHQRRIAEGFFQRAKIQAGWKDDLALAAVEAKIPRSMMGKEFVLQYGAASELSKIPNTPVVAGRTKLERLESNYTGMASVNGIARSLASVSKDLVTRFATVPDVSLSKIELDELKEVARILSLSGQRPKVVTTSLDGWDFHSNLKTRILDTRVTSGAKALSSSLKALADRLKSAGTWDKTTIVVMSEFGRRMVENGAQGADHGRGGVGFILGGKIQGQRMIYASDYVTRLSSLYSDGRRVQAQLPVDFDYRLLLTAIFEKRFGMNAAQIYGQENSIFAENILANAASLKLDTSDVLMTGLSSNYSPTTSLTLARQLVGA